MAFIRRNMHNQDTHNISKIWYYRTDDTALKVSSRNYFEDFTNSLAVGDWIFATTSTGGIILHVDEIDPLELSGLKQ